jgi:hypothetical protein
MNIWKLGLIGVILGTLTLSFLYIFSFGCTTTASKIYNRMEKVGTPNYSFFKNLSNLPHITFEYPSIYDIKISQINLESKSTSIWLTPNPGREGQDNFLYIQINVDDKYELDNTATNYRLSSSSIQQGIKFLVSYTDSIYNEPTSDPKLAVTWRIDDLVALEKASYISDLVVLENTLVKIGPILGREVVFSFSELPLPENLYKQDSLRPSNNSIICRFLYFKTKGYVYEIVAYGDALSNLQNQADYEHVIGTLIF